MQPDGPEHGPFTARERVAEILAGVWIEQTVFRLGVALDRDVDHHSLFFDVCDLVIGIRAARRCPQLVGRQLARRRIERRVWRTEQGDELASVYEGAPRHTEHDDVEAERKSGPEVDLKEGSPEPDTLRLLQPLFPQAHGIGCQAGYGVRATGQQATGYGKSNQRAFPEA